MHVVGKHDPGVDVERRAGADLPNCLPQRVDLCHQQIRPAVEQVHREEECPTWNPIATIFRHDETMPGFGEGRKALRFSVGVDGLAASGAIVRLSKHELETVHDRD